MNKRRVVIAAGGTGGHLFPATSLAHELEARGDSVLFIGGGLSNNPFFERERFSYREVPCCRLSWKAPTFPLKIARGFWQSVQLLKTFKPQFLIGFGSYFTFPTLLAARFLKIPYVLHEQNSVPGRVNRFFMKSAKLTAVHFPSATEKMKGPCRQVAMPLRQDFQKKWDALEAKKMYRLTSEKPVLLTFGGSQGSEFINQLLHQAADRLTKWQVIHFTGSSFYRNSLIKRYGALGINAFVSEFETDMARAWSAADCVVSRAGAASIAEQLALSVPGILIPYPHATDDHQDHNADFLVELGGAVKLSQNGLTSDHFINVIEMIAPRTQTMRMALGKYHECQDTLLDCLEDL